jgi:hypothetical protein
VDEARVALQAALGKLAVVEKVLFEIDPVRSVSDANDDANVNVDYKPHAE